MNDELSLLTKYRPKTFDEVFGHKTIIKSLKKVLDENKAKAFLFTGPSGVGKTTLAKIVANYLCEGEALVGSNIIEINGASNTGVDDARELVSKLHFRAIGKSPIKVVIFDECHRASNAAWSSLLKPIEEPSAHVYWCLCTTEGGKILKTIKTRCLQFDLKPLKEDDIYDLLIKIADGEGYDTPEEVLEVIAESSGGSPRQAIAYLAQCEHCGTGAEARSAIRAAGESEEIIALARLIMSRQGRSWDKAIKIVNNLSEEPESVRIFQTRYFTTVVLNSKEKDARRILPIIESFSTPYNQTDGKGPLLLSLGEVFGLDE